MLPRWHPNALVEYRGGSISRKRGGWCSSAELKSIPRLPKARQRRAEGAGSWTGRMEVLKTAWPGFCGFRPGRRQFSPGPVRRALAGAAQPEPGSAGSDRAKGAGAAQSC